MIYFDNAATTFPKPNNVLNETFEFARTSSANPGRSAHNMSVISARTVFDCRQSICDLINAKDSTNIAFTKNCSEALNIGLKSSVKENTHVISTVLEHNSIIRVLEHLKQTKNITVTYVKPDKNMVVTREIIEQNLQENTTLIAMCHANNILGTYNDIEEIGDLARQKNITFLVDVAQSIGKTKIDVEKMNIDILCAPGHKSLFGLSGTGFIYAGENIKLNPIMYGGTGSFSDDINQPEILPDRLETGTLNVVGIKSLLEGIKYINGIGIENIEEKDNELTKYFIEKLSKIEDIIIYTPKNERLAGIVSFNVNGVDSSYITAMLNSKYDIAVRGGLHCNPLGHRFLKTLELGFVRASIGWFNTKEEVDDFVRALKELVKI